MLREIYSVLSSKIRASLLDEVEPEKWSSWVRISLATVFLLLSTYAYIYDHLPSAIYFISLCTVIAVFFYSGAYLFLYYKGHVRIYTLCALIFFDVVIVTGINASAVGVQTSFTSLTVDLFSAFPIVIMFNAFYNRKRLSVLCGVLSFFGFSLLYIFHVYHYSLQQGIYDYFTRASFIIAATMLATIIAHRNFFTMNKVISSEMRYQKLLHRLPEMLFTVDAKGIIVWATTASRTILGVESEAISNRHLRDFMTKPELLKLDKSEFKATFQLKDFGSGTKYVDCFIQPLKQDGEQALFEGIMIDVSDREIAIFQREEMVKRLYQYQKMESLGTLASGMAHDFNNILQTVSDIVSQVENETMETTTKKHISTLSESLIDAKFLISELLALGRKQPLDYKPINLLEFFNTVIPQFCKQISNDSTIIGKMPDKPLWIQGDADYFKRVIQNLVDNAHDAMPAGGTITIECSSQKNPGKSTMAVMRIIDTGTGIPSEIIGKVFDPFFTTKKPGKGTGLGLALVQRIVSLHNGVIVLEKTDHRGTTFRIEIPESERNDTAIDTKEILFNRRMTRVLILEDDPKIRGILKFFLAEFNYPICEASDAEEGSHELRKYINECELVIMDWKLGSDDPHEVIRSLRVIKPQLIVIVVSGYPPRAESISSMSIFKWITKPYDKNQLDLEIQKALYFNGKSTPS